MLASYIKQRLERLPEPLTPACETLVLYSDRGKRFFVPESFQATPAQVSELISVHGYGNQDYAAGLQAVAGDILFEQIMQNYALIVVNAEGFDGTNPDQNRRLLSEIGRMATVSEIVLGNLALVAPPADVMPENYVQDMERVDGPRLTFPEILAVYRDQIVINAACAFEDMRQCFPEADAEITMEALVYAEKEKSGDLRSSWFLPRYEVFDKMKTVESDAERNDLARELYFTRSRRQRRIAPEVMLALGNTGRIKFSSQSRWQPGIQL